MPITTQQLLQILPNAGHVAGVLAPVLNTAMHRYQIVGAKRIAAFMAQIGHESGQLKYAKEIWGPTKAQLVTKAALSSATPTRATAQVSRPWPDPDHGPRQQHYGHLWLFDCSERQRKQQCLKELPCAFGHGVLEVWLWLGCLEFSCFGRTPGEGLNGELRNSFQNCGAKTKGLHEESHASP